jgi:Zn-dependent peptidase ImmA (M78 family)
MSNVARVFAGELVASLKLVAPVDLVDVTRALGLEIHYCDSSGFDGALVCSKQNRVGTVLVKRSIRELGRRKFTIAHEIGHYVLPHHGSSESVCSSREVESWDRGLSEQEIEANVFAGELLIPERLIDPAIKRERPSMSIIREISTKFETSLTAAAYRAMYLTPFRSAIVWSTNGVVRWFKASQEFEAFVSAKESVAEGTYAFDSFRGKPMPDTLKPVKSELWLAPSSRGNPDYILEHSIAVPTYNSVLTLLCIEDSGHSLQDDDEGRLEALDPEDFTLKRRSWPR